MAARRYHGAAARLSYSLDGVAWVDSGAEVELEFGQWKGARVALFTYGPGGGWADFDRFEYRLGGGSGEQDRSRGTNPTRESVVAALEARVKEPERLRHAVAVEAIMRELARRAGEDPDEWGLAGLMHDIDRTETDAAPSRHGIVGSELLTDLGCSEAVVRAVETHDDQAGRPRTLPIAHALFCADQVYWRILSSGLRPGSDGFGRATPADVVEGLRSAGQGDGIDDHLRRECRPLDLTMDDVLQLSLDAMRDVHD